MTSVTKNGCRHFVSGPYKLVDDRELSAEPTVYFLNEDETYRKIMVLVSDLENANQSLDFLQVGTDMLQERVTWVAGAEQRALHNCVQLV